MLAESVLSPHADIASRSTTTRQLRHVAGAIGLDADATALLLRDIRPPAVIHYSGHMFAPDANVEAELRARIAALLDTHGVGCAFGALAAGADLLIAEAVLARGGELHVVLPFVAEDFIAQSVRPCGDSWVARYEAALASATTRTFATEMHYVGDPGQYGYASRVAMGLAKLRAQQIETESLQLAIWDGVPSAGPAGTGADVDIWTRFGGVTEVIAPGAVDRGFARPPAHEAGEHERALAAILFTDFKGFSKLAESALPAFWGGVMKRIADVLDAHEDHVQCRNSWGDALYAVADTAAAAAEIALRLQSSLAEFDHGVLGLADQGGMRIGAHYGPAYRVVDAVTGRPTFYGTEVSRAARIEPVTPPGAVFVTEPFAAILTLEAPDRYVTRYVGRIELAKGYGTYPMYRLSRA